MNLNENQKSKNGTLSKNKVSNVAFLLLGAGIWNLGAHFGALGKAPTAQAQPIEGAAFSTAPPLADANSINIFAVLSKLSIPSVVNISTISTVRGL